MLRDLQVKKGHDCDLGPSIKEQLDAVIYRNFHKISKNIVKIQKLSLKKQVSGTVEKVKNDINVLKYGHHDDQNKNIFQLVRDHGYFIKSYKYETGDGYINTVFRVMPKTSAQHSSQVGVTNCDCTFQKIDPAFNRTPNPKIFCLNAVKPDLG